MLRYFDGIKNLKMDEKRVKDESRSGRAIIKVRTDNNARCVHALVHQDQRLINQILTDEVNINCETIRQILVEDFFMRKLYVKVVQKNLSG